MHPKRFATKKKPDEPGRYRIPALDQYIIDSVTVFRYAQGISQPALCELLGLTKSFVGNVESASTRNRYNIHHLYQIASHFKIPVCHFLPSQPLKGPTEVTKQQAGRVVSEARLRQQQHARRAS